MENEKITLRALYLLRDAHRAAGDRHWRAPRDAQLAAARVALEKLTGLQLAEFLLSRPDRARDAFSI